MRAAVLGRSWALRAAGALVVHVGGALVELEFGRRVKRQSLGPAVHATLGWGWFHLWRGQ